MCFSNGSFGEKMRKGINFSEKGHILKMCPYEHQTLTLTLCQSVRECPNFLKL
jgi:hypothetical protein